MILDLFCGGGGAAVGYDRAGFEPYGVDLEWQPYYPYEYAKCDWEAPIEYLLDRWRKQGIKYAIHASPPCQLYSRVTPDKYRWDHPDLVGRVREVLMRMCRESWFPYVIENVPEAPLEDPVMLCGSMFGLGSGGYMLRRHRMFESNIEINVPGPCDHYRPALPVYGHTGARPGEERVGIEAWREGMGIPWMMADELAEAIPPAFTEWIGGYLFRAIN